jgi:hypothetical protein
MSKPKQNPLYRLPEEDRLSIKAVVDALNDNADLSKAESRIVTQARRGPGRVKPDQAPSEFLEMISSDIEAAEADWQSYWQTERFDFLQTIRYLTRKKRLSVDDAEWLVDMFNEGVTAIPAVDTPNGRAKISFRLSFANPQAAVAYVLLRLSSLGTSIFACKECQKVVVPELEPRRAGRPNTEFCCPRHRWKFNKRNNPAKHK